MVINGCSFVFYGLNCINSFIDFIFYRKLDVVYCHNLKFDGSFIISFLSNSDVYFISNKHTFVRNGSIFSINIFNNKHSVNLRCSLKLFPLSIKEIGFILKITKGDFNICDVSESNYLDVDIEKSVKEYCVRDAYIVYVMITKLHSILCMISNN